jgi:uncharacterized integral membrane protein
MVGYYNWKDIVESKSNKELESFFENENFVDIQARYCALNELKKRNISLEKIAKFQSELLENCDNLMKVNSKTSMREYLIIVNPYLILLLGLFFLIKLLFNLANLTLESPLLIFTLFFLIFGLLVLIVSRIRIRKINRMKDEQRKTTETIIKGLKN